ncbi:hypothetical protein AMTRI_Chr10g7850 [Amborella trichopoda]
MSNHRTHLTESGQKSPGSSQNLPESGQKAHEPGHQQLKPISGHRYRSSDIVLRKPPPTNFFIRCGAVFCIIFIILLILGGIITLVIYLVIKPKHPSFEISSATLNSLYIDSPQNLNSDFTFLANFSNPNQKIDIQYEYLSLDLYFGDTLIATQAINPFFQKRGVLSLASVQMISSEVYLSQSLAKELRNQIQNNRITYDIRGTFRTRAIFGISHFTYWLYGRCRIVLTGPPSGIIVARYCRTKQ